MPPGPRRGPQPGRHGCRGPQHGSRRRGADAAGAAGPQPAGPGPHRGGEWRRRAGRGRSRGGQAVHARLGAQRSLPTLQTCPRFRQGGQHLWRAAAQRAGQPDVSPQRAVPCRLASVRLADRQRPTRAAVQRGRGGQGRGQRLGQLYPEEPDPLHVAPGALRGRCVATVQDDSRRLHHCVRAVGPPAIWRWQQPQLLHALTSLCETLEEYVYGSEALLYILTEWERERDRERGRERERGVGWGGGGRDVQGASCVS